MTELQLIAPNTVELVDPLSCWHTMWVKVSLDVSWWHIEADKAVQSDTEFSFLCTSSKAVQGIDALDKSVKSH